MFDLITIGDSTLDQFNIINDAELDCKSTKDSCRICFDFGSKIPIKEYREHVGGDAPNVAVGAKKLGLKTAIYTELGRDDIGIKIANKLNKFGVDSKYIKQRKGTYSNHSSIITYQKERTIFSYHSPKQYKMPRLQRSRWLYLTSLSNGGEVLYSDIIKYIHKYNVRLAFGPGTYQLKQGRKKLITIFANTYFYVSNMEEAQILFGSNADKKKKTREKAQSLLEKIIKHGVRYAIITDGTNGAFAYDGLAHYSLGCYPAKVVEKTGAGDSFASACISAFYYNKNIDEALEWGTINASGTMSIAGAQNGLRTKREIETILKNGPKYLPQEC